MTALMQSGAGMLGMYMSTPPAITEADALARLPRGSSISETGSGFIAVVLNVEGRAADAFADFCYPHFIPGQRLGFPCFAVRRANLGAFVERWEAWA